MVDLRSSNPLVQRLRVEQEGYRTCMGGGHMYETCKQAADEIERLSAELAYAKANANTATNTVLAENVVLKAERDRLAARVEKLEDTENGLLGECDRLAAELEALKHDVDRYIAISSQEATESSRLHAALERYGRHTPGCNVIFKGLPPTDCTCGFREALAGEDRPKDRPEVNAALPIGADVNHSKRTESAETAPNADKVAVSRLSDETPAAQPHPLAGGVYSTDECAQHRGMPWSYTIKVRTVAYTHPLKICPICHPPEQQ